MARNRPRHNEKARKSTAGSRNKGKRRNTAISPTQSEEDPNALITVPKSEPRKELERKERIKQELLAQSESKFSGKKKKRLEKYIEKKLKQEERVVLFEKLSKSQTQLPNALGLASSSTLGTGKVMTHQERLEREEHHEMKHVLHGRSRSGKRKRSATTFDIIEDSEEGTDSDGIDTPLPAPPDLLRHSDSDGQAGISRNNPVVIVDSGFATQSEQSHALATTIGSALKHNPDGSVVAPRIVKKKAKTRGFSSWRTQTHQQESPVEQDSDSSFDSSDSAYDSDRGDTNYGEYSEEEGEDNEDCERSGDMGGATNMTHFPAKPKLGFKEWAMKQLSMSKSYVAVAEPESEPAFIPQQPSANDDPPPPSKKRKVVNSGPREMRGPLGRDISLPDTSFARHIQEQAGSHNEESAPVQRKVVEILRPPDVEAARLLLPIVSEEQPIMEAILLNSVVVICGETGSGKTTQVPQFLYEAGFGSPDSDNPGMIGITQPRRVAAMSMASRVAHELSLTSSKVSYQIRYDATVSPSTSIKFMTDGVLLRELATDFLLTKYSVIIIDEAHERSMNTDVLIGVLSRVVRLREEMWIQKKDSAKPLRLIIMSATLRVSDFAENTTLFSKPPPVISVQARQHPVTIHFSRRTVSDYVTEAIRKTSKIHARLPLGGILIFLTGQNEIVGACKKLEARYGTKALEEKKKRRNGAIIARRPDTQASKHITTTAPVQADVEAEDVDLGPERELALDVDGDMNVDVDPDALDTDSDESDEELGINTEETDIPMHIVPLYALLPSEKQMKVFEPPPPGTRLVVVSTNVAETSLTIPGIRYVVDCGRAKERRYDVANGIQAFQVTWTSKASASQRAGRAGRTGPGHCYRLYSSALYENYFKQFSQPEILRMPIEGVTLQMKAMHIDAVVNFPFPTPPDRTSLRKAEKVLTHLGALTPTDATSSIGGKITDIGRAMSLFPLSPRYARMLVSGRQHGCLPYIIGMVSALSVGDPFLREEVLNAEEDRSEDEAEELAHLTSEEVRAKEARRLRRKAFFQSQEMHAALGGYSSDILRILSVVGAYEYAGGGHGFCEEHFVRPKAMEEIHKLRAQISNIVQTNFPDINASFVPNLLPPNALQLKVLRQLVAAGFIDQVAVRKDKVSKDAATGQQYTTARGVPYRAVGIEEDVYIHPTSVLAGQLPPDFVVYLEIVRTSKVWIKGLTVTNAAWLPSLGKSMCTFSKPIKTKDGKSVVIPHFGPGGWELPPVAEASV